jgi:hypothetical protein
MHNNLFILNCAWSILFKIVKFYDAHVKSAKKQSLYNSCNKHLYTQVTSFVANTEYVFKQYFCHKFEHAYRTLIMKLNLVYSIHSRRNGTFVKV